MVNVTLTASDFCENVPPNFRKINTFEVGSNSMKRKFNIFKKFVTKKILNENMNIFFFKIDISSIDIKNFKWIRLCSSEKCS